MINKSELIFVVDSNNNPIEPQERHLAHNRGYWHRVSHIYIVNNKKQVLCQRRSLLKDMNPGKWEPFFGGHLAPNQEYLESAVIEVNEELGLAITKNDLHFLTIFKYEAGHEYEGIFYLMWDGDINRLKFEEEEIDQLQWFSIDELQKIIVDQNDSNWSHIGHEKDSLERINNLL